MNLQMNLDPGPWARVKSGEKTIELRLYDEKRRKLSVGDFVTCRNTETGEPLNARVLALHVFPDFAALYAALPLPACGYRESELAAASYRDMEQYYAPSRQAQYGVVGIEIEVIGCF